MVVMSNTPINISGALGPVIQQNQLMTNEQNKQQIQMQQMKAQQAQQVHQQSILQQVIEMNFLSYNN